MAKRETVIRRARKALGLSLIDLSRKTLVNPSVLSQVECQKLVPSARVRDTVCGYLKLDKGAAFLKNGLAA
jgi:transcriptional regulator with XRE-family HTH domain